MIATNFTPNVFKLCGAEATSTVSGKYPLSWHESNFSIQRWEADTNRCCLLTIPEFKVPLRAFDEDEAPTPSSFLNDQSSLTNTLCFTPNH